jgi:hypothetical protein
LADNNKNEQVDAGIPERGDDVLRAYDVIPSGDNQQKEAEKVDVPEFDLGDQILSEHRKISSVKRRGPGMKSPDQGETSVSKASEPVAKVPSGGLSEEDRIIASIVADDIKRLVESS